MKSPRFVLPAWLLLCGLTAWRAAANPPAEFNPAALQVDEAILSRGRIDLVLLLDGLRSEWGRLDAATAEQLVNDFHAATRPSRTTTTADQLARAKRFLAAGRLSYQPPASLALSVHAVGVPEHADALCGLTHQAPDLGGIWSPRDNPFGQQLEAIHRATELARGDAAFRRVLEAAVSGATGGSFRLTDGMNEDARWVLLRTLSAQNGRLDQAALETLMNRMEGVYSPLLEQAHRSEREIVDAYEKIRSETEDPDLISLGLSQLPFRPTPPDPQRAQRRFETQALLGLAASLADAGGNHDLARDITRASDFYMHTDRFIETMSRLSAGDGSFAETAMMANAVTNYIGLTMSVLSMMGDSGPKPPDANQLILEGIEALRKQLVDLGRTMDRRFNLVDFRLANGFSQTLNALASVQAQQRLTAEAVRGLTENLEAFRRESAAVADRTVDVVNTLDWRDYENAATQPYWDEGLRKSFHNLVQFMITHSRDTAASSAYSAGIARTDLLSLDDLTTRRLSAEALAGHPVFAKGNFLRGYFEAKHGVTLSPAGPVPNLARWLRGAVLMKQMLSRFPQLAGQLSAADEARVLAAPSDLGQLWTNLASAKTGRKEPGFTYEGGLFEASLKRIEDDLRDLHRAVQLARVKYAETNGHFDYWDEYFAGDPSRFAFALAEIGPAEGAEALAVYDKSRGLSNAVEEWRQKLPLHLKWRGTGLFAALFTPTERLGHAIKLPEGGLSVKLHRHGWVEFGSRPQLGPQPGKWLVEFGLYRDDKLLRTLTILRNDETTGDRVYPPGSGMKSQLTILAMHDAAATAERIWASAADSPLASIERASELLEALWTRLMQQTAVEAETADGPWRFILREQVESWEALTARRAKAEEETDAAVKAKQDYFMREFAPQLANVKDALDRYEEDRVALYVLANLAAPQSLASNSLLQIFLYRVPMVLPREEVITEGMCTDTTDYAADNVGLARLRKAFKDEYSAGRFPQTSELILFAQYFYAAKPAP